MLAQDLGRLDERLLRRHRPIRPDVHDQPIVVRPVSDTRVLDPVPDPLHRPEHRVDRDLADDLFLAVDVLLGRGLVTTSFGDPEFRLEIDLVGEGRDDVVRVVDRDRRVRLDEIGGDLAGTGRGQPHGLRLVAVEADDQALDVEDDVNDILKDARHRRELVGNALNLRRHDRRAFDRGQQDPPEAVPDRRTEAPLKRFHGEATKGIGRRPLIQFHLSRKLKPAPSNMHCVCSNRSAGPTWPSLPR